MNAPAPKVALGVLLRKWFFAGLLVWLPLGVTLLVIRSLVSVLDTSLLLIPKLFRPDVPGLGVVLSVALVLVTGMLTANMMGKQALSWAEAIFSRIPLVRSIYGGMKKLAETVFSGKGNSFRKVVLIEYPRKGLWSVGFLSGAAVSEAQQLTSEELLTVFVPTTPNPTSGFIMLVPKKDVIEMKMSVEEGMRFIISLGVVTPDAAKAAAASGTIPAPPPQLPPPPSA